MQKQPVNETPEISAARAAVRDAEDKDYDARRSLCLTDTELRKARRRLRELLGRAEQAGARDAN
jgi:hypothetical protein